MHLHLNLRLVTEWACHSGKMWFLVPVLRFADNVLCKPTQRVKERELWQVKGNQAPWLCFSVECWLSDNRGHTFVLCLCPGYWVCCSSYCPLLQECSLISLLLLAEGSTSHSLIPTLSGWKLQWTPGCRAASVAHLSFSLLASLVGSHLPTFTCCNLQISQMFWCIEQGVFCWIVAVQIVETSRGETKGISQCPPPLHPRSSDVTHYNIFILIWVENIFTLICFCLLFKIWLPKNLKLYMWLAFVAHISIGQCHSKQRSANFSVKGQIVFQALWATQCLSHILVFLLSFCNLLKTETILSS